MENVEFIVTETLVNSYNLKVNVEELNKRGKTIKEYLQEYGFNPWFAVEEDNVIEEITFNEMIDYISADCDNAEIIEKGEE